MNNQQVERIALEDAASEFGQGVVPVGGRGKAQMLAFLEERLAAAERGEMSMDVLVLSGHSGGRELFGERTGADAITFDDLAALSRKYPKAFGQVRHAMFLACFAGTRVRSAEWETLFPNVISVVGFTGRGPSGKRSANFAADVLPHMLQTEKDAKGYAALSKKLSVEKNRRAWERAVGAIGNGYLVGWSVRTCGHLYARNVYQPSDDAVIDDLEKNANACHDWWHRRL